jgi:hypothetical protein
VVVLSVAAVGATFGLKRRPHRHQIRSEAFEHGFDHVVGSNAKNRDIDLRRQMPVPQVPGKTCQLSGISVPDLYNRLRCRLYLEPSPIVQPQSVAIGHSNSFGQIEEHLFTLIRQQADTPAVTIFEIESDGPRGVVRWPMTRGSMNRRSG